MVDVVNLWYGLNLGWTVTCCIKMYAYDMKESVIVGSVSFEVKVKVEVDGLPV